MASEAKHVDALVKWIGPFGRWQLFATLTTRLRVSDERFSRMLRRWTRTSARVAPGHHLKMAVSSAPTPWGEMLHAHAVIAPIDGVDLPDGFARSLSAAWTSQRPVAGLADIKPIYDADGAIAYTVAHFFEGCGIACGRVGRCKHRPCMLGSHAFWV